MRIEKNYDLTYLNTFKIACRADFFCVAKNQSELLAALDWAKEKKLPVLFLAGGSNVVFAKKRIKGLVVKISGEQFKFNNSGSLTAWAGTALTKLAKAASERGFSGLEWAYGLPGSLGGAVRGNAGAYGGNIAVAVAEVQAYDFLKNKTIILKNKSCGFGYRQSIFKKKSNLVILSVKLKLKKGQTGAIKALAQKNFDHRFGAKPKEPSAGCIFKNLEYKKLIKENLPLALELEAKGLVRAGKIGVGYLIDQSGLKGKSCGGAKISQLHANFIVNSGQAAPQDVIKLIKLVKKIVKQKYKINLEEEVQYFGG